MLKFVGRIYLLAFITLLFTISNAEEQARTAPWVTEKLLTVQRPIPNDSYMINQHLTIVYDISSKIKDYNIQMSIALVGTTSKFVITDNADITLGSQQMVDISDFFNTDFTDRKFLIYNIPGNVQQGSYQVMFYDSVSGASISIPITVVTTIADLFNKQVPGPSSTSVASVTSITSVSSVTNTPKPLPTGNTISSPSNTTGQQRATGTPTRAAILPDSSSVIATPLNLPLVFFTLFLLLVTIL